MQALQLSRCSMGADFQRWVCGCKVSITGNEFWVQAADLQVPLGGKPVEEVAY